MPVIPIRGMPDVGQYALDLLVAKLGHAIEGLPVFGISQDWVFPYFPVDIRQTTTGRHLIAPISGIELLKERDPEVLRSMAKAVAEELERFALAYLPNCTMVEAYLENDPAAFCLIEIKRSVHKIEGRNAYYAYNKDRIEEIGGRRWAVMFEGKVVQGTENDPDVVVQAIEVEVP